MSRRFGRNQRRRAREALASAQAEAVRMTVAYEMAKGLAEHQGRTISELKAILREATDIAGRMCIAFPVDESIRVEWPKPPTRWQAKHERVQAHVPMTLEQCMALPDDDIQAMTAAMPVEHLPVLLTYIEPDALHRQVHARVQYSDNAVGYAIGEKSIALLTRQELERRIYSFIAPDIARHLSHELKGKKP